MGDEAAIEWNIPLNGKKEGEELKALSVRQPWAWAIIHAGKDIENRDWHTSFRGRIAIHAAKGMTQEEYEDALDSMFSRNIVIEAPLFREYSRGAIIGTVEIMDCVSSSDSPWFQGDYGFVLRSPIALPEPIPCKGALNFWDVPPEIERLLTEVKS